MEVGVKTLLMVFIAGVLGSFLRDWGLEYWQIAIVGAVMGLVAVVYDE